MSLQTLNFRKQQKNSEYRSTEEKLTWKRVLMHGALILACFVMLYPVLWMVRGSLAPETEIFKGSAIPSQIEWSNYTAGWNANPPGFGRFLINSLIVCGLAVIGNLITCTMAAYAFARIRFVGSKLFFGLMLMSVMIPSNATLIPQYSIYNWFGLIGTYIPLVLPKFLAMDAFFIFLLVQFLRSIPKDLDEAAEIDGCGHFRRFFQILLPVMTPALATTAVFTFIWAYEDFMGPLIYLADINSYTVPLGLRMFMNTMGQSSYGQLFAMTTVSLIPAFLIFTFFQKQLIEGIATTGMKG